MTTKADELFWDAIDWLMESYSQHRFFRERDVVWTVQKRLLEQVRRQNLPYKIYNDFAVPKGGCWADLVLIEEDVVDVAIEFKYEPSRSRENIDIPDSKLPVVASWGEVAKDVQRVREFVENGHARSAFSLFINEGRLYLNEESHGGCWENWRIENSATEIPVFVSRFYRDGDFCR